LAEAIEFRDSLIAVAMGNNIPEGYRKPTPRPDLAELWGSEWQHPVDALTNGEACVVHRYELPDWCSDAHAGYPSDYLTLTEDNELVEFE
jgi:hypothetical protein